MTGTTDKHNTIPYTAYHSYPEQRMLSRAEEFLGELRRRRSVRDFATRGVPRSIIEACIASAGTAPSGANQQPWYFVAVEDKEAKHSIRLAAEEEEREFYDRKAPDAWLQAIEPLGTNAEKTFLERAPWLIAVFQQRYSFDQDQRQVKHYYPAESVGRPRVC